MNHLIPLIVFTLLALWNFPPIREKLFAKVKRLPQWAQPIPPVLIAGLTAMGQGLQDGVSGEALLELGANGAGTYGAMAIGLYHVVKRWWPLVVRLWVTFRKTPNLGKIQTTNGVITLANANDISSFKPGMKIEVSTGDGSKATTKVISALLFLLVVTGCTPAARQQIVHDATESACALQLSPAAQEYAKKRKIPLKELAALACAVIVTETEPEGEPE